MTNELNDLKRLYHEYIKRDNQNNDLYSITSLGYLYTQQQRMRATIQLFKQKKMNNFFSKKVLEIGCGTGGILLEYMSYGCNPSKLYGIDLLYSRLKKARFRLNSSTLVNADAQNLPYPSGTFDIVLQYTAFSSVLDQNVKKNMAREIVRVLNDQGVIIWYDFWINPTNKQTRGIRPREIRQLFYDCNCEFRKITLAPPITRRIVKISWCLTLIFESLNIFNSHYLVFITKSMK